jgi:thiol-disulfide isomerase/thioredoxin
MKRLAFLLFINFLIASAAVSGQGVSGYFNEKDSVRVTGNVIGFWAGAGDDFISFLTFDITGESKKQSFQLAADGSFDVRIFQPFAGDVTVNYKSNYISMLTRPGLRLQIDIQDREPGTGTGSPFFATGDLSAANNLLFAFQAEFRNHTFEHEADMGDKGQADSTYAASRLSQMEEELAFLHEFVNSRNPQDTLFKSWQRNQIIYSAGKEILLFPFLGRINKDISASQLLRMIRSIPINSSAALQNSAYYDFLRMLVMDGQIIVNINPGYQAAKEESGYNPALVTLELIDHAAGGLTREVMYYDLFYAIAARTVTIFSLDRFGGGIHDPYLKARFLSSVEEAGKGFRPYHLVTRLRELKVGDDLKLRLLSIFKNAAGQNLFIDFWGDWCGPCMMEMPRYPGLIKTFEQKNLKFIFFSVRTTGQSVARVREKFGIKADFINLTNDEVAIVNNIFDFHSYPGHFVINSQGYVVGNHTNKAADIEQLLFK